MSEPIRMSIDELFGTNSGIEFSEVRPNEVVSEMKDENKSKDEDKK